MTTSSDVSGSSIYNPITSFARVRSRKKNRGPFFPPLLHLSFLQLSDGSISLHKTIYWQTVKYDRGLHQTHTQKKKFRWHFSNVFYLIRFWIEVLWGRHGRLSNISTCCLFVHISRLPPCPEKFTEAVENGLKRWKGNLYIFDRDGKRLLLAFVMLGVGVYSSFPLSFFLL